MQRRPKQQTVRREKTGERKSTVVNLWLGTIRAECTRLGFRTFAWGDGVLTEPRLAGRSWPSGFLCADGVAGRDTHTASLTGLPRFDGLLAEWMNECC